MLHGQDIAEHAFLEQTRSRSLGARRAASTGFDLAGAKLECVTAHPPTNHICMGA
jgi:hypothetical protein